MVSKSELLRTLIKPEPSISKTFKC